jgi:hypothetical protein
MTKIFTMIKDEEDIVTDWVLYHGTIFGFRNLYVVDNYSKDGTWQALQALKRKYNINICKLPDYRKKGRYMTNFMHTFCGKGELAFPINIDEFIVCYDRKTNKISCDQDSFSKIFRRLPVSAVYKMNYINCKMVVPDGYKRATIEATSGTYNNYSIQAKSFFNPLLFNGIIDHGNHFVTNNYVLSDLCLVHYHCRNLKQIKNKIYNNVLGLGYNPTNLHILRKQCTPNFMGYKNIREQVNILEHKYKMVVSARTNADVNLAPISKILLSLSPVCVESSSLPLSTSIISNEVDIVDSQHVTSNAFKDDENIKIIIEELITVIDTPTLVVEESVVEESVVEEQEEEEQEVEESDIVPGVEVVPELESDVVPGVEVVPELESDVVPVEEPIQVLVEEPIQVLEEEPVVQELESEVVQVLEEEPVVQELESEVVQVLEEEPVVQVEEVVIEEVVVQVEEVVVQVEELVVPELESEVVIEEVVVQVEEVVVQVEEVVVQVEEPVVQVEEPIVPELESGVVIEEPVQVPVEEVVVEEAVSDPNIDTQNQQQTQEQPQQFDPMAGPPPGCAQQ